MSDRVFSRIKLGATLSIALAAGPAQALFAVSPADSRFVGAAGCQSSSCHGGAGERWNQSLIWVKDDFHSRAYAVLVNARSARMAETLGLPAAQSSARCTVCHSPLQAVAPSRLTTTAQTDEGVSCESCHGAAGAWLRGHTRRDWTYAMRVGAGLRDLRSFYVRANTCVACHQNLETDLLTAGHPELTFELDGQSAAEPRHWREEDRWSGPRAWLVGQAVALREMSWALANSEAPLPEEIARWSALAWLLAKTTANQPRLPAIDSPPGTPGSAQFAIAQEQADLLAREAGAIPWDLRRLTTIWQAVAATDAEFVESPGVSPELLFHRASRLVLALDRLSRPLDRAPRTGVALAALFADVRVRPDFQGAKFAADLAIFRKTIGVAP